MAFQSALESNKNMRCAINMTPIEQIAIGFTYFIYVTAGIFVCVQRRGKETIIHPCNICGGLQC